MTNLDQPKGIDGKYTNRDRCDKCDQIIYDFWQYDDDGNMLCPECTEKAEKAAEYNEQYRQECIDIGEHMKRTVPDGGYDICFNCGSKS